MKTFIWPLRSARRPMISATRRATSSAGRSTSCAPRRRRWGCRLELRPTTFDTLIPGLQAKRFDAAVGQMGVTVVREKVVDMVGTLFGNELFAALADSPIKVNSLDDLCGLTVATTRGSREMVFADEHQPKCAAAGKKPINALAFNDGNGAAEALMSRRADLYWLGSTAISYFVAQSKGRTKVVGSYTDTSYIGVGAAERLGHGRSAAGGDPTSDRQRHV